jgi:hypothetical protein
MNSRELSRRNRREWLVALCVYALVVAPGGCPTAPSNNNGDGTTTDTAKAGLFVNSDLTSPVLAGGRNAAGDAFFIYGRRDAQGRLDISSIEVQPKIGNKSFIIFKSGRPVYAQGPDGSYVKIAYTTVTATSLAGTVEVHDAVSGRTESHAASVDLTKVAQDVANQVQQVTGHTLVVPQEPNVATAKAQSRQVGILVTTLTVIPLVLFSEALVLAMGQIMTEMFQAVADTMQAVVIAACTPVFLFASIFSDVTVHIESLPLLHVFINLPAEPQVTIEF